MGQYQVRHTQCCNFMYRNEQQVRFQTTNCDSFMLNDKFTMAYSMLIQRKQSSGSYRCIQGPV